MSDWLSTTPIAHRGLHGDGVPENSMAAFDLAASAGYGFELDVHLTLDGHIVVFHDDDLTRMTGVTHRIRDVDYSRLAILDLAGSGERIPLLSTVIGAFQSTVPIIIEVKSGSAMARLGPALLREIARIRNPVAIQSFDVQVLLWLRRNAPQVVRGQLAGSLDNVHLPRYQRLTSRRMLLNSVTVPGFLAYDISRTPSGALDYWRRSLGVPVLFWTIRSPGQAELARSMGANIIFEHFRP